jgi:rhodanese-related sulfurtransferase
LVDAREITEFAAGHIRGSINIPVDGRMAETIGMVLKPEDRIILVTPEGEEEEAAIRFVRIGYDNVAGFIPRPEAYMIDHQDKVVHASRLAPTRLDDLLCDDIQLVDVRNIGEIEATAMIEGAVHIPLAELSRRIGELDPTLPTVTYCAGGWRSSVASSYLAAAGFEDVSDVLGGYAGWEATHSAAV